MEIQRLHRAAGAPTDVFVMQELYAWMVEFEVSICAFQIGDYQRALVANERILQTSLPHDVRDYVARSREARLVALGRYSPNNGH